MRLGLTLMVAAVVVVGAGGAGPAGAGGTLTCVTVPPLSAAAKQALLRDGRGILMQLTVGPSGIQSVWTDAVSRRSRSLFRGPRGKIQSELVVIGRRMVDVEYDTRTWTSSSTALGLPFVTPTAAAGEVSRTYRNLIANRQAKIVGHTTIDGVPAIHLRQLQTIPPPTRAQLRKEVKLLRNQLLKHFPKGVPLPRTSIAWLLPPASRRPSTSSGRSGSTPPPTSRSGSGRRSAGASSTPRPTPGSGVP